MELELYDIYDKQLDRKFEGQINDRNDLVGTAPSREYKNYWIVMMHPTEINKAHIFKYEWWKGEMETPPILSLRGFEWRTTKKIVMDMHLGREWAFEDTPGRINRVFVDEESALRYAFFLKLSHIVDDIIIGGELPEEIN